MFARAGTLHSTDGRVSNSLSNRKRAIVALVHTVVFLLIAVRQMVAGVRPRGRVPSTVSAGTWALCAIFAVVLAIPSGCRHFSWLAGEDLFWALCHQRHRACCGRRSAITGFMPGSTSGWRCWPLPAPAGTDASAPSFPTSRQQPVVRACETASDGAPSAAKQPKRSP